MRHVICLLVLTLLAAPVAHAGAGSEAAAEAEDCRSRPGRRGVERFEDLLARRAAPVPPRLIRA